MLIADHFNMTPFTLIKLTIVLVCMTPVWSYAGYGSQGIPGTASFDFAFSDSTQTDHVFGQKQAPGTMYWYFEYSHINHPLIEIMPDGTRHSIVDSLGTATVHPSYLLSERSLISLRIPYSRVGITNVGNYSVMGDLRLQYKYRFTDDNSAWQFAVMPELLFGTGDAERFNSMGSGAALKFILERQLWFFRGTGYFGYQTTDDAAWKSIDYTQQLLMGLGAEIPITDKFFINAESNGSIAMPYQRDSSTGEYYLGGAYKVNKTGVFYMGASLPSLNNEDNDGLRFIAGVKFAGSEPNRKQEKEIETKIIERVEIVEKVIERDRAPVCSIKPFSVTYYSRPINAEDRKRGIEYPYDPNASVDTHGVKKHMKLINVGEMSGITPKGLPYVLDMQVPFAIELSDLPPKAKVKKIDVAQIKMSVVKLAGKKDVNVGTEAICFLNEKVCSGELITLDHWMNVTNHKFINEKRKTANDYFSKLFLTKPVGTFEDNNIYSMSLTMDLKDLLKGSKVSPIDLLYNNVESGSPLFMTVVDDTFVNNDARLELRFSVEVCE